MSMMIQAMLFEKYGPRLNMNQLSEALDMAKSTIYNKISAGTLGVKTYLDDGKRVADVRDVAAYLDEQREKAA